MNNNYLVSVALACLFGMQPITAEMQTITQEQSLFKTLLKDFRCMRQKGFKRCAPEQKRRMVKTGTTFAIVLLSASGVGIWFGMGRLGIINPDPVGGDEAEKKEASKSFDSEEGGREQEDEPREATIETDEELLRSARSAEIAEASGSVVQELAKEAREGEETETPPEYLRELTALLAEELPAEDDPVQVSLDEWDKLNAADKERGIAERFAADSVSSTE